MAMRRNEVVFNSQPTPPPNNENKLAQFLASIGKFVETPQGQQTATNLASAIPLLFGRSDIASGITGAGQQTYDRQMQEQKAQEQQVFRDLQMQLAQSQQNIQNQRKDDQFAYQQEKDAENLAIDKGKLNLGRDNLDSKNQIKSTTGAPIPSGYVRKDPEIAKMIPPSLIERAQNGDVYVNSRELPSYQVNTLSYNEKGKSKKQVVFTNTPKQAVDLNTATKETKLLIDLIDEAYILREKFGKESLVGNKKVKSRYEFLSSEMGLKIKNIYGLGVLSMTDIDEFINKMVPNLNGFFEDTVFAKLNALRRSSINDLETHKNVYVYDPAKDLLNQYEIQPSAQNNFFPVDPKSGAKIIGVE